MYRSHSPELIVSASPITSVEGMCKCTHAILCRHTMYAIRVIYSMLRATFCSADTELPTQTVWLSTEIATPPAPPHGTDDIGVVAAVAVAVNVTFLTVISVIIVAVIIACKLRQKQQTPLEGMNGLECFLHLLVYCLVHLYMQILTFMIQYAPHQE